MFRLNRNERSHWSGNGVHVESELVFMIGRNMQRQRLWLEPQAGLPDLSGARAQSADKTQEAASTRQAGAVGSP